MMKKTISSSLIALFLTTQFLYAGNPVMLIRCLSRAALSSVAEETYVPDCSLVCEECPSPYYDETYQTCNCKESEESTGYFCGCPDGLTPEELIPSVAGAVTIPTVQCVIPDKNCYDGDIEYSIAPFECDATDIGTQIITITITGVDGSPLTTDDALTINDLQNCILITEDNFLNELKVEYGSDVNAAFIPDDDGVIVIEFTRDPSLETVIDLRTGMIVIPACPTLDASDPCSCNPNNVTDADGNVLFWYDELTIVGSSDSMVTLLSNNNPQGFLMPTPAVGSTTPFADGANLGTLSGGVLVVPFYKDAASATIDIEYGYSGGSLMTTFSETCGLAANACIADPIPTLGEWSIMILAISLMIIGIIYYRKTWYDRLQKERIRNRN